MGGLLVILPVAVIVIIYKWVYDLIGGWLAPITEKITRAIGIGEFVAIIIVVACGAGSSSLVEALKKKMGGNTD